MTKLKSKSKEWLHWYEFFTGFTIEEQEMYYDSLSKFYQYVDKELTGSENAALDLKKIQFQYKIFQLLNKELWILEDEKDYSFIVYFANDEKANYYDMFRLKKWDDGELSGLSYFKFYRELPLFYIPNEEVYQDYVADFTAIGMKVLSYEDIKKIQGDGSVEETYNGRKELMSFYNQVGKDEFRKVEYTN